MAEILVGTADQAAAGANVADYIFVTKKTAIATATATTMRFRVAASVAGNVELGIYADNAGAPAALLGHTGSTAVGSGAAREVEVALLAGVSIESGTAYWLASNCSAALMGYITAVGVPRLYKSTAFGNLPNPAGAGYTDNSGNADVLSAWGTVAVGGGFLAFF